ncbi:MAG: tRNA pseudouridine(55) synthase TruB [bacterium]|nr:tRNA pseudouridine(55) synthase TruB [bacterium]
MDDKLNSMNGFLLVDKPGGFTSHDVVAVARRMLKIKKIGHAGTLDPMATGLLILGVGSATKKLGNIIGLPKTYTAEITLSATSTTDDREGVINELQMMNDELRIPTNEEITMTIKKFIGEQQQVPPQFSAIKINGQCAYKKARQGETVELKPRTITIYDIKLISYEYPLINIETGVSSGTYIRSLARDIGQTLKTGAYLSKLERTSIGEFKLNDAVILEEINESRLFQIK